LTADVSDLPNEFEAILRLSPDERCAPLARLGRKVAEGHASPELRARLIQALVASIAEGAGAGVDRVEAGEALGWLGDPRLHLPTASAYWVAVETDDGTIRIGKYPVTNQEYRLFVDDDGYSQRALWSDAGWAWLAGCNDPWPERSKAADARPYIVPNQPVVAVTWFEADACARYFGARLPRFDERTRVMRGVEKRPYPWGSPFGEGHANTREEVLGRPCAVGLFLADRTPEGACDLAGNAAEWVADQVGEERWYHPGAWDQPSMAAWAKARELERPDARWAGLGFRLARD
jgi:hypothetical protein